MDGDNTPVVIYIKDLSTMTTRPLSHFEIGSVKNNYILAVFLQSFMFYILVVSLVERLGHFFKNLQFKFILKG